MHPVDARGDASCAARALIRAAAIGVIVVALGHDLLALLAQTGVWPADFASYYVPARAVIGHPSTNVYDYGALLRLNATEHDVAGTFYPYIYPPFALLVLRPLAVLPWSAASTWWALCSHAAAIGSAWLLAAAFTLVVRRQAQVVGGEGAGAGAGAGAAVTRVQALDRMLSATALDVRVLDRRLSFPLVPLAVTACVLLLAWPAWDTYYWGQINFVIVFLLVLALYADLAEHPILAGVAIALAGGLKLTPLIFLGYFALRGRWKTLAAGIVATLLIFAIPLLFFPAQDYDHLRVELGVLDSMFVLGDHNESFIAVVPHIAALLGHGSAATLARAERLGEVAAGLIGLITVLAIAAVTWLRPRSHQRPQRQDTPGTQMDGVVGAAAAAADGLGVVAEGVDTAADQSGPRLESASVAGRMSPAAAAATTWLTFALTLAAYTLVTPLVWSHFYVVALPCALMLAAYPLLLAPGAMSSRLQVLAILAGSVGVAVLTCELPFGADLGTGGAPGPWALVLLNLRPLALGLVWLVALMPLLHAAMSTRRLGALDASCPRSRQSPMRPSRLPIGPPINTAIWPLRVEPGGMAVSRPGRPARRRVEGVHLGSGSK